jgi:PPM family protein phosphatase
MSLSLRFAARSDVGLLREGNEDSVYAGPRVLAVADGMGGHAAGEVASAIAIAALAPLDEDDPGPDLLDALRVGATSANEHLRDMVSGDAGLDGMGTTLTAMLFAGSRLGLLHVGDSRCYLLRDGALTQITHDHTLVQALVDEGRISEDEAGSHPQRSLITRALDGRGSVELDLSVREARPGDRYLLCTDGLTGPVGRLETLQEALSLPDPQEAVDRLVELALRGGGPDNITVIVADVVQDGGPPMGAVVGGAAAESPQEPPPGARSTAASRARDAQRPTLVQPRPVTPTAQAPPPRRRRRTGRAALVGLVALAVLGAGALAGWAYLRAQYYVGVDGEQVAVFRGVNASLGGLSLATVDERTDLDVERLDRVARPQVERGWVADDRADALAYVERLQERAAPECPEPQATPSPSPVPDPSLEPAAPEADPAPTSFAPPEQPGAPVDERCPQEEAA